ncbi:hypothetical protein ACHAWF_008591 [Thalassiosira exigua]
MLALLAAGAAPPSLLRGVGAFLLPPVPVPVAPPACAVGVRPRRRSGGTRAATSSVPPSASAADVSAVESLEASLRLERGTWTFRDRHPVAYEVASSSEEAADDAVPILLLNGFGVGSFHQHRLMRRLLLEGQNGYQVYGVDYLGQGSSWPSECDDGDALDERGLGYSADMWLDQIEGFVEEVVLSRGRSEEKGRREGGARGGARASSLSRDVSRRRSGHGHTSKDRSFRRTVTIAVHADANTTPRASNGPENRLRSFRLGFDDLAHSWLLGRLHSIAFIRGESLGLAKGGIAAKMGLESRRLSALLHMQVHLVGNSVGGYLATMLARRRPDLVDSLVLLNATPVWGLNLPGWDGRLPAPLLPKLVGRTMFDFIRDLGTIDKYLEAAYVRREAYDGTFHNKFHSDPSSLAGGLNEPLGAKIRACTEGTGGHAAFASILWSAPASDASHSGRTSEGATTPADFYEALGSLSADVLLLFGDDDPWCTSAVAKRMHVTLCDRAGGGERDPPAQRYVALEGAGHCPNHEAPGAVAKVAARWIEGGTTASDGAMVRRRRRADASLASKGEVASEPWGDVRVREVSIEESRNLGFVDRIVSAMVG